MAVAAIVTTLRPSPQLDPSTPEGLVQAFFQAVEADDWEGLRALLARSLQDQCEPSELAQFRDDVDRAVISAVEPAGSETVVEVRASRVVVDDPLNPYSYDDTFHFVLAQDDGRLAVSELPWQFYLRGPVMSLVLLLLVLIGGVVALPFVLLARRRTSSQGTSPAEVVTYLILAIATLITTNSISSLLEIVIPGDDVLISGADDLALSLSTLIVAGVVAVALWIAMERTTNEQPRPARELYLAVVIAVSMAVVASGAVRVLLWAVGASDFEPSALGDIVAFGGAWFIHERLRRRPEELDELRQIAGALIGLGLSTAGVFLILLSSLGAIIDSGLVIAGGGGLWEQLRVGLVLFVVGVPYFWWFWLRGLASRPGSWRNGYAVLVSVAAWFSGFTALAVIVNRLAQWVFGLNEQSAALHFGAIPTSAAAAIVAAVAYWHHRPVLGQERNTAVRIVEYVFSAVGLVAGAGAVVTLAAILGDNLFGDGTVVDNDSRIAVGALVVLILSALTVWRYWLKALRLSDDPVERMSAPRRGVILILRVGFFLVGAGALVVVLFVLLRSALEGEASQISSDLNVAVPLVAVSGLMVWHLAEQRTKATAPGPLESTAPVAPPVKLGTVTVVATDPGPLPTMIPGMRFLKRGDGIGVVDQGKADEIVAALGAVKTAAALVTVDANGYSIVPIN